MTSYSPQIMHGVERADRNAVVQAILNQETGAEVHTDPEHRGPLHTMIKCLTAAAETDAEWAVVMQDDAMPVSGWRKHLIKALRYSPEPVLGLTYFGYAYSEPKAEETVYFRGRYVLQGGAFAVHRDLLDQGMVRWLTILLDEGFFDDDVALAAFSSWLGHQTACVTNALFTQPLRSTLRNRPPVRPQPQRTIGEDLIRYEDNLVEDKSLGACAPELGLLLQGVWTRLNTIVQTHKLPDEVWWTR